MDAAFGLHPCITPVHTFSHRSIPGASMNSLRSLIVGVLFLSVSSGLFAQSFDMKEHYTKKEVSIAMRDGVKLFTAIYTPKDTSRPHPILMVRSPYSSGPYGEDNFPQLFALQSRYYAEHKYIIVSQDVRGRYMSEGAFMDVRPVRTKYASPKDIDETTDTYDTVDWLVKHVPNNNGRVGIHGISYPGFYAWMGTINAHPAMKATSPQAPVSQWMSGDDFYHNGAFLVSHAFQFYAGFGWPRPEPLKQYPSHFQLPHPDGYRFFLEQGPLSNLNTRFLHDSVEFWNQLTEHDTWDSFWAERSVLPHLNGLKPAVLVVGGWFDAENLYGALHSYQTANTNNPSNRIRLVMGPWAHGWWQMPALDSLGDIKFGSVTTEWFTKNVVGPYFDHELDGAPAPALAEATVFMTGQNEWRQLDAWPPKSERKTIYFDAHRRLTWTKPSVEREAYDEYVNDPATPVPYTEEVRPWYNPAYMLADQRFASRRPDVLTYQSDVLTEDVTVAGPITVRLTASTTGTDCDWIVKVIDVFPDTIKTPRNTLARGVRLEGYQMMVRGDVLRGKFRTSMSKPEPFTPNAPTEISYDLQDVFHRFKKGHRIMVQVQSSWFPKIDRNPGVFMDIFKAKESDFTKTTQRVYRSAGKLSGVELGIYRGE